MTILSDAEKLARLRLIRTENIGPITFKRLIERFGTAQNALERVPDMAKRGGQNKDYKVFAKDAAEKEMAAVSGHGATFVFLGEKNYPPLLAEIEDAPPVITVAGKIDLLSKNSLGVVGARNASISGRRIAESFSGQIGKNGYVITSGLARGIDSAAHQAALATGTIAVVAGGIDVIYPPENKKLYDDITAEGAIVAESPFGVEPLARHFPKRNRIISGLSLGVVVIEAAEKSGSLITAQMALEQNREVFAVPGSPLDPRAAGCNRLIKDGAHMALSADDILQSLNGLRLKPLRESATEWTGPTASPSIDEDDSELRKLILENLSFTAVEVNDVIRATKQPAHKIISILLELELAGRIERSPGNKVNLI